jgi:hypothetical protein
MLESRLASYQSLDDDLVDVVSELLGVHAHCLDVGVDLIETPLVRLASSRVVLILHVTRRCLVDCVVGQVHE